MLYTNNRQTLGLKVQYGGQINAYNTKPCKCLKTFCTSLSGT